MISLHLLNLTEEYFHLTVSSSPPSPVNQSGQLPWGMSDWMEHCSFLSRVSLLAHLGSGLGVGSEVEPSGSCLRVGSTCCALQASLLTCSLDLRRELPRWPVVWEKYLLIEWIMFTWKIKSPCHVFKNPADSCEKHSLPIMCMHCTKYSQCELVNLWALPTLENKEICSSLYHTACTKTTTDLLSSLCLGHCMQTPEVLNK